MTTPLLSLCEFIVDCEHKTAPTCETGYPSIRTPNVGRGRLILDGVNCVDEDTYRYWTKRAVPRPGDLIIAREAPVGNVAIVMSGQTVCLGQRTVLVRPNAGIVDPQYLTYFMLGSYVQDYFYACSIGATVPHLNMKDIRSLPVPRLPPLDVQHQIAGILSAYDDLIEVNTRRIAILEEIARRLFDEWFVAKAPPEDWHRACLGDFVEEVRDAILPSDVPPDTPYVGLEHMPRRSTTITTWGRAEEVGSTKHRFQVNDILFGKIRPYFHKVIIAPVAGVSSSDAIVMRPIDEIAGTIAACLASSDAFVAHAVQTSNGTKMPRANWSVLRRYEIALPPPNIVQHFAAIVEPSHRMCSTLAMTNMDLRAARDLLLPKLISGEIDLSGVERGVDAKQVAAE